MSNERDKIISDCALTVFKALSGTPAYTEARHIAQRAILAMRSSEDSFDIVARLRRGKIAYVSESGPVYEGPSVQDTEAADEIDRLRSQIAAA